MRSLPNLIATFQPFLICSCIFRDSMMLGTILSTSSGWKSIYYECTLRITWIKKEKKGNKNFNVQRYSIIFAVYCCWCWLSYFIWHSLPRIALSNCAWTVDSLFCHYVPSLFEMTIMLRDIYVYRQISWRVPKANRRRMHGK